MNEIGRKRKTLLAVACASFLLAAVAFLSHEQEPSYQGHSLSYWLQLDFDGASSYSSVTVKQVEAAQAVRQIGTNALPFLVEWIQEYGGPWECRLSALVGRTPLPRHLKMRFDLAERSDHRRALGELGFRILGAEAAPAVPALTNLLYSPGNPVGSFTAAFALASIGSDGLPPLLQALTDTNYPEQRTILMAIQQIEDLQNYAPQVVPAIANYLKSPNAQHPAIAVEILAAFDADTDMILPVIESALHSPSEGDRYWTARLLPSRFQKSTHRAIPILQGMMSDPDEGVRSFATNALSESFSWLPADANGLSSSTNVQGMEQSK